MLVSLLMLQAATPAAAVSDCSAAEHRQLDFWLGSWEVRDTRTGAPAGESEIAPVFKGCGLQETFRGVDGFEGGSLSLWDRGRREWVQFGSGSTGARRLFAGRWEGGRMSLLSEQTRPDAPVVLIRMHLQPAADGAVRQWSESSGDYGVSWRVRYDYTYRRKD
jgi:hypothetical protein